jgi:hydrogenase nickel incorporation protein HypB
MRTIRVQKNVLEANDEIAERLRSRFRRTGTLVLNLVSSPGSGKTTLLEATSRRLSPRLKLGAVVGDIATERDAERLRRAALPAHQILTAGACHLDARLVEAALGEFDPTELDVLFIENVGNLICPTSYDLGEDHKIVLLSVVEGDDKPAKYPAIFSRASVVLITKADLLPHVTFDMDLVRQTIETMNPSARILTLSALTGEGMGKWCDLISEELQKKRGA